MIIVQGKRFMPMSMLTGMPMAYRRLSLSSELSQDTEI
jgi:lipopolysaccharide export LptBFGC system permease protein LptF